jgi:sRNA-binding carbon storage regulator CsrA
MSNDFQSQMPFDNPQMIKLFWREINKRIRQIIKEECKYDKSYSAIVITVGTGTANIKLQGGTNTITNVKNKSGETLVIGNEVIVEAINGSLNNLVIKYKK